MNWKNDVCSKMREIRPVDSDNWGLLGTYESQLFNPTPYSFDMNDKLTQLSIWLERLWHYIDDRT